jgi:hypothetical protein
MRRTTTRLVGLCLAALTLAGCTDAAETANEPSTGVSETAEVSPDPSASGSPETGQSVDITFSGSTVTPNGERIDVALGEPLTLNITADAPGELHVHSTPEQELAYDEGTSQLELTIDQPGVVEVESHDLELTILQLEVR